MAEWTHRQCERCWINRNTAVVDEDHIKIKRPVMVRDLDPGQCCFCTEFTVVGIFVRHDPKDLACEFLHEEPE